MKEKVENNLKIANHDSYLTGGPLGNDTFQRKTLADVLSHAASGNGVIKIIESSSRTSEITYSELFGKARRFGAMLNELHSGDHVILMIDDLETAIIQFWGSLLAGKTIIPLQVSNKFVESLELRTKMKFLFESFKSPIILCTENQFAIGAEYLQQGASIVKGLPQSDKGLDASLVTPEKIAIVLATSGSTSLPKLVPQTHSAILDRCRATTMFNGFTDSDIGLNWFPLDHVGGIVMAHIQDMVSGASQVQVATNYILESPSRWMQLCSDHSVTMTWAPNFAFKSILDEIRLRDEDLDWDLSSLRFILNGGEAVVGSQARDFLAQMSHFGLPGNAMNPSWGMSETCSGVTFNHQFIESTRQKVGSVSVGFPLPGIEIKIVDESGQIVTEKEKGRLLIKGNSILDGYLNNPQANEASIYNDGWFDTGDIAYLDEFGMTMTGREKDVIIVNGLNVPTTTVESIAEEVDGVVSGSVCAFAWRSEGDTTDRGVLILSHTSESEIAQVVQSVRSKIKVQTSVEIAKIFLIDPDEIPRTSIGKVQKKKLKERFESGELEPFWVLPQLKEVTEPELAELCAVTNWTEASCRVLQNSGRSLVLAGFTSKFSEKVLPCLNSGGLDIRVVDWNSEISNGNLLTDTDEFESLILVVDPLDFEVRSISLQKQFALLKSSLPLLDKFAKKSIVVLTQNGQSILPGEKSQNFSSGFFTSILRAAQAERGYRGLKFMDLDNSQESLKAIQTEAYQKTSRDSTVGFRFGTRYEQYLSQRDLSGGSTGSFEKYKNTHFVFFGAGSIVEKSIELLSKLEGTEFSIVSRFRDNKKSRDNRKALEDLAPGRIDFTKCDVGKIEDLKLFANAFNSKGKNMVGIFASGAYESDGLEAELSTKDHISWRAKALGMRHTLEVCLDLNIKELLVFSSLNGFFSGSNVAVYSLANQFQQFLADSHFADGLSVRVLNWSMWEKFGMSSNVQDSQMTKAKGFSLISPEEGKGFLKKFMSCDEKSLFVGVDAKSPILRGLFTMPKEDLLNDKSLPNETSSLSEVWAHRIQKVWEKVLDEEELDIDNNVFDIGANSLNIPQVRARLKEVYGLDVRVVEFFKYATIREFSEFIENSHELKS